MATVQEIRRKRGSVYRAAVCVDRRRVTATFDTRSEAHRWAEEVEERLRAGLPLAGESPAGDMDFRDAVERYTLAVAPRKKANTRRLDQEIGGRLIRHFAGRTLAGISRADLAGYRDLRLQSVGPSSVIQDLSFVRCLYRAARIEWGLEVEDPSVDLRRPSAPHHRLSLLSPDQVDRLLDWCCVSRQELLPCYVLLQLHSAMRPSEGAGLRWDQVRQEAGVLDLTTTKTDPRRVPMTPTVQRLLADLRARRPADNPHVFLPDDRWRALPHRYFRRAFGTACRQAGIEGFSLYGLRHSAASYLIMAGVDIRTVAEIMGHRNISQTMRYTHFLDAHRLAAIAAIDRLGR